MTKSEKLHLSRVAGLGCIVCRNEYGQRTPAAIHHIRGGHGVAIHAGQKTWESLHGTELELLAQVRRLLEQEAVA